MTSVSDVPAGFGKSGVLAREARSSGAGAREGECTLTLPLPKSLILLRRQRLPEISSRQPRATTLPRGTPPMTPNSRATKTELRTWTYEDTMPGDKPLPYQLTFTAKTNIQRP